MVKRVLVGCEFTGTVRNAFSALGFDAWSCDLEESETEGQHIQDDLLNVIGRGHWDLLIAHPPCTDLVVSGAWMFKEKELQQQAALDLVLALMDAPIPRIAIENPISIISTKIRKPDQIIQPWWFGDEANKSTCLWLKNLPRLKATNPVITFGSTIRDMPASPERQKNRSRTYEGIAKAMALQWGGIL